MFRRLLVLVALVACAACAQAAPALEVEAYLLMDRLTQTALASRNENKRVNPGNTTSLMVLYVLERAVADNRLQPRSQVSISADALSLPPLNASRFYVENSKSYTVSDLMSAVAAIGANDAIIALAEHVAGSVEGFVQMMNEAAKKLGMHDTHYVWPIAIDSVAQYTTAKDIYVVTEALLKEFPGAEKLWMQPYVNNGLLRFKNTNPLIWRNEFIRGVHMSDVGHRQYSAVGYFAQNFTEGDLRFSRQTIAVCLNGKSSESVSSGTMELITWGAQNFKTLLVYTPKDVIDRISVSLSANASVRVGVKENVYVTVEQKLALDDGRQDFSASVERMDPLVAPIRADERIGTLHIYHKDKEVAQAPLFALHDVESTTFWYRAWQSLRSLMANL